MKRFSMFALIPISYLIMGYLLLFAAVAPYLSPMRAVAGLLISDSAAARPDPAIKNIYVPGLASAESGVVSIDDIVYPNIETQYAELRFATVSRSERVYFGTTPRVLAAGVGQNTNSGIPGMGTTVWLYGYNSGFFAVLERLAAGDSVTLVTNYGVYRYEVYATGIYATADETSKVISARASEGLALTTDYPFGSINDGTKKYAVYCRLISGPAISQGGSK